MTDHISVQDAQKIRTIRFNRLDKKNAITRAMYATMADALERANQDDIRVVILAGGPGVFSAGNDMVDFLESPPHIGSQDMPSVERFMRALMGCEKPVIAAIDGLAIGIGTTLVLHCDLAYATPRSVFTTPFVNLALAPEFGSSQILPGIVGRVVASELLLLGEAWDGERAEAKLLINKVLPEEGFEDAVMAIAQKLAALAPSSVKVSKALITRPDDNIADRIRYEGDKFAELLAGDEFKEAASAFLERRAPDFSKFN